MEALTQMCDFLPDLFDVYNRDDLEPLITTDELYDLIYDMAPTFEDTIKICWWLGKLVNCSDIVFPVMTEEGICFTYNSLNSYEIYSDK